MNKAFVLGAGLGTRLRPLTDVLPKPLIPVGHIPLAAWAFAHLRSAGVREFVVNTHHLPHRWSETFPGDAWEGLPICYNHEPLLLETGGGLADVAPHLADGPFLVYNGDILTDIPLAPAMEQHLAQGNMVTLILRSTGAVKNVAFDPATGQVRDLRNLLGTNATELFQFTGLYIVEPAFFLYLRRGAVESVVPAFLRAIQAGERIGGVVIDAGEWHDLGDRRSYLEAHRLIRSAGFPSWGTMPLTEIHPEACVEAGAQISRSWIGPGAVVGAGAIVEDSILWPGARVAPGAQLRHSIVRTGSMAEGVVEGADV